MAHPDPFLRSMALWVLGDYTGSLNTLLQTNVGTMHPQYSDEDKPDSASKNSLLNCTRKRTYYEFILRNRLANSDFLDFVLKN